MAGFFTREEAERVLQRFNLAPDDIENSNAITDAVAFYQEMRGTLEERALLCDGIDWQTFVMLLGDLAPILKDILRSRLSLRFAVESALDAGNEDFNINEWWEAEECVLRIDEAIDAAVPSHHAFDPRAFRHVEPQYTSQADRDEDSSDDEAPAAPSSTAPVLFTLAPPRSSASSTHRLRPSTTIPGYGHVGTLLPGPLATRVPAALRSVSVLLMAAILDMCSKLDVRGVLGTRRFARWARLDFDEVFPPMRLGAVAVDAVGRWGPAGGSVSAPVLVGVGVGAGRSERGRLVVMGCSGLQESMSLGQLDQVDSGM